MRREIICALAGVLVSAACDRNAADQSDTVVEEQRTTQYGNEKAYETSAADPAMVTASAGAGGTSVVAQFKRPGTALTAGTITVVPAPGGAAQSLATVKVDQAGATAGGTVEARVQSGTCSAPGQVLASSQPMQIGGAGFATGQMTIPHPIPAILGSPHAALLYAQGNAAPLACVELPRAPQGSDPGVDAGRATQSP